MLNDGTNITTSALFIYQSCTYFINKSYFLFSSCLIFVVEKKKVVKNVFPPRLHWQINTVLYSSQWCGGSLRLFWQKNLQFNDDAKLSNMSYHLCSGKKWGQLPVPNSSDCPNTIAKPAPDQAHHLLTRISWCQAQQPIHPTTVLIPWAFHSKTSGEILPFRTCGCLAHINCNCFGLDVIFFHLRETLTSFASIGRQNDLPSLPLPRD